MNESIPPFALGLVSEHEQDLSHALEWWREASEEDKLWLWMEIQRFGGSTRNELISRMAQLGFTMLALEAVKGAEH